MRVGAPSLKPALLAALLIGMMILTTPANAASSTLIVHFNGVVAPAAWGAPFQPPGPVSPPGSGPGPFPPPPLVVVVIPTEGHIMTARGEVSNGVLVELLVMMTDPGTGAPSLLFAGNSTSAAFMVDGQLTTASLTATVQGLDLVSFSQKTITITVTWTTTDPLTGTASPLIRTRMDSRVSTTGFSLTLHSSVAMRLALASGTLSIMNGATIPLPPSPAAIARADFASITRIQLP